MSFNACAYSGSYGFWSFVDLLSGDDLDHVQTSDLTEAQAAVEAGFLETLPDAGAPSPSRPGAAQRGQPLRAERLRHAGPGIFGEDLMTPV